MRKILEDLIFSGHAESTVDMMNKKWTLKSLNSEEQLEATGVTGGFETFARILALKIEILGRSLKSVDDIVIENVEEGVEVVKKLPTPLVNKLYEEYEKLVEKQNTSLNNLDELKNS